MVIQNQTVIFRFITQKKILDYRMESEQGCQRRRIELN